MGFADSPAGRQAAWWIEAINGGGPTADEVAERVAPGAMPLFDLHQPDGLSGFHAFMDDERPWRLVETASQSEMSVQALVEDRRGARHRLRVDVDSEPPHRIVLVMAPPQLDQHGEGRGPSATAAMTATARAGHLLWAKMPVFRDDLAIRLIPDGMAVHARASPLVGPALGASLMVLVRSRYAEDTLFDAAQRGVRQYVLLGAGLDSFAYRHADTVGGLRVYEIDEPASQQWKRDRLVEVGIAEPPCLSFVPVDFTRQDLGERLAAAGFDSHRPSLFAWLGVIYYLDRESIERTLAFVASTAPGTELVFDYMDPTLTDPLPHVGRVTDTVGESLVAKHEPAEIDRLLASVGLLSVCDISPADAGQRYFANRSDGLTPTGQLRVRHARVAE